MEKKIYIACVIIALFFSGCHTTPKYIKKVMASPRKTGCFYHFENTKKIKIWTDPKLVYKDMLVENCKWITLYRFGSSEVNVQSYDFLPFSEWKSYIIENLANVPISNFSNKGTLFLYDAKSNSFKEYNNVIWTGNVKNGKVDGKGFGYQVLNSRSNEFNVFEGLFSEGILQGTGKVKYYKQDDISLFNPKFVTERQYTNGINHNGMTWFKKDNLYGFVNSEGKIVYPPLFDSVYEFVEAGNAIVTKSGIDFLIDKVGNINFDFGKFKNALNPSPEYLDKTLDLYQKEPVFAKALESFFLKYAKEADKRGLLKLEGRASNLLPKIAEFRPEIDLHDNELLNILNEYGEDKAMWKKAYIENAFRILKRNDESMCSLSDDEGLLRKMRRVPLVSERIGHSTYRQKGVLFYHTNDYYAFFPDYYKDNEVIDAYKNNVGIKLGDNEDEYYFEDMKTLMQGLAVAKRIELDLLKTAEFYYSAINEFYYKLFEDAIAVARKYSKEPQIQQGCNRAVDFLNAKYDEVSKQMSLAYSHWKEVWERKEQSRVDEENRREIANSKLIDEGRSTSPSGELVQTSWLDPFSPYIREKNGVLYSKNGEKLAEYNIRYDKDKSFEYYYIVSCIKELDVVKHSYYEDYKKMISALEWQLDHIR